VVGDRPGGFARRVFEKASGRLTRLHAVGGGVERWLIGYLDVRHFAYVLPNGRAACLECGEVTFVVWGAAEVCWKGKKCPAERKLGSTLGAMAERQTNPSQQTETHATRGLQLVHNSIHRQAIGIPVTLLSENAI
jgi:hypothetical protein